LKAEKQSQTTQNSYRKSSDMAQIDIESIFNTLKTGIVDLAKKSAAGYVEQAKTAGQATLNAMKEELQTWTTQLKNGEIDEDDLKDLIAGREDLIKLEALKQAGIAKIELDKFKNGIIDLVTKTLSSVI
jgi:hypothetical protein